MSDNIKVVVKVRPLIPREIEDKLSFQWRVKNNTLHQLDQNGRECGSSFTFDKVYDQGTVTHEVYNDIAKPIVEAAIAGFNGTIFAYGQTSSGKTYTMTGTEETPGIIPLAVLNLFENIKNVPDRDFLVRVSYIEIYNETLIDLLSMEKKNIKIHDTLNGVKVDVTEKVTASPEEVLGAMKEGQANRQTGATYMNEESSRSHSIFQITIESREHIEGEKEVGCVNVSQLNLVDLAGSERAGQTGATGIRFKEGTHINKSLSVLALVIKQLSEISNSSTKYINYRDSKLTRILQNSLGGNAKTSIICAVTPASVEETISTLQFANRAKAIQNKPEVNAVATNATMIQSLTKQLSKLQSQLEQKKNLEVMLETKKNVEQDLQNKIAALQKMILNGFAQKSRMDLVGHHRRKLQPPRRITISTLHPIEEDPVPDVPKFCTPSLKYNPMQISASMEFLPIPNASKLATLPEDTPMLVTPPPQNKKVNFEDEIIDLDSDDDDRASDVQPCSPYHSCYVSSKTPPCILRKNAKLAEKNLKDIVKLTEREKMYTPSVVELIEKLENNTNIIAKLEEQVNALTEQSKDKDSKIDELKNKISKTEEEIKNINNAKLNLEARCKEYDTMIIDWEVSYETLEKKSKSREQDLLSLLEEQKVKKVEDIGKSAKMLENFMEMSKEISLVNSDSSITNDDESTNQLQDLVTDMKAQLSTKNEMILQLENNIMDQNQKIDSLESSIQELQETIEGLKNKHPQIETENSFLKSTIDTLNSTIENQKQIMEKSNRDIESYNNTIQELQMKFNNKEKLSNVKIDDSVLETLIANEEIFIANNENIKNIIHSFKIAIDKRNKEIDTLKSKTQVREETSNDFINLKEQIENKEKQINRLIEEVEKSKNQISENVEMIKKLMGVEQELTQKLSDAREQNDSLRRQNEENTIQIENLEESNEKLSRAVAEKEETEKEISTKNEVLTKQVEDLSQKINDLENNVILHNKIDFDTQDQLVKAKSVIVKIKDILLTLNPSDTREVPEIVDSIDTIFNFIKDSLNILEATTSQIIIEKNQAVHDSLEYKEKLLTMTENHKSELVSVQLTLENMNKEREEIRSQNKDLLLQIKQITEEFDITRQALQIKSHEINSQNEDSSLQIKQLSEELDKTHHELEIKSQEIISLNKDSSLQIKQLSEELDKTHHELEIKSQEIISLNKDLSLQIKNLSEELNETQHELEIKSQKLRSQNEDFSLQIKQLTEERDQIRHELQIKNQELNSQNEDLSLQRKQLTEELHTTRHELEIKSQDIIDLQIKFNDSYQNNENLRNDILSKEALISSLQERISSLNSEIDKLSNKEGQHEIMKKEIEVLNNRIETDQAMFDKKIQDKDEEITELCNRLKDMEGVIEEKLLGATTIIQDLNNALEERNTLLNDILEKAIKLADDSSYENNLDYESINDNVYDKIVITLKKISEHITILKSENANEQTRIEKIFSDTQKEVFDMKQENLKLNNDLSETNNKNQILQIEMERINNDLIHSSTLLIELKTELTTKAKDLENMENKAKKWKDQFMDLQYTTKKQINNLVDENQKLNDLLLELNVKAKRNTNQDSYSESNIRKSLSSLTLDVQRNSPQSLLTICCNKIIEAIQPHESDYNSVTTSSSKLSIGVHDAKTQTNACNCTNLTLELNYEKEENQNLLAMIKKLQSINEFLVNERDEVRKEIQLLMEPAIELQKKIANHKTNLSTLTATTYAENKLLNSQLKVLKHHHTRYIHVCQRDIPAFKTQLHELMSMLKGSSGFCDKQNSSFKRYSLPDVLDSNTSVSNIKNESTFDGDLLMLDTNLTLTTSADSTLVGNDQTCLDVTQVHFDSEVACQTSDLSKIDPYLLYAQMETLTHDNQKLYENLECLRDENLKLKEEIEKYSKYKTQKVDAQISPIKINGPLDGDNMIIAKTYREDSVHIMKYQLAEEVKILSQELADVKAQRDDLEKKYANLSLEIPATDTLVRKLSALEKECISKTQESAKITSELSKKSQLIKHLQEENDALSTQVMENISEADDLKKELDTLKDTNATLLEKCEVLDNLSKENTYSEIKPSKCPNCAAKDELINSLQNKQTSESHSKLNRSFSDSDSSSRHNKICTLQHELHASKEDCKKITEEVATIKNHLELGDISMSQAMDLDESMGDSNIFTFSKEFQTSKSEVPNVQAELPSDLYTLDKIDCFNYYVEKTGAEKENINSDIKILDIMKSLYYTLVSKHGSEVENLVNKLKNLEESKTQLQNQIENVTTEYSKVTKKFEEKENDYKKVTRVLSEIQNNIKLINTEKGNIVNGDNNGKLVTIFKEHLLHILDTEFGLSSVGIFENIIDSIVSKHQNDLSGITTQYTKLKDHMESVAAEFNSVNDNLQQMKSQLSEKENEYNLLKAQKEKMYEISNAVTLDIIKKEQDLIQSVTKGCEKLVEYKLIIPSDIDMMLPPKDIINLLFERLIRQKKTELENESQSVIAELNATLLEQKEKEIENIRAELSDKENLNKMYEEEVTESKNIIQNLNQEIKELQVAVYNKETIIQTFEHEKASLIQEASETRTKELMQRLEDLLKENDTLKSLNKILTREKEHLDMELQKSGEVIKKHKVELDKMTEDIKVLRESVGDNVSIIESLTLEAKSLMEQNMELKKQYEEKCQDCSRLEQNIRTHEKTAEIQTRMINRLQTQNEKDKQIDELTEKCAALQKECETLTADIKISKEEIDGLKNLKESLEERVSALETEVEGGYKRLSSIDAIADNSRRRRQSIYDSKRMFAEEKFDFDGHSKIEEVFDSRTKPDDLFMDVDEDISNRSSPVRLSRGRDSFSKQDHSDKDDELCSRPSSVLATRRRRQSIHDLHRSALRHTPSPHDTPHRLLEDGNTKAETSSGDREVSQLRERLAACQEELEDLKERYRELDDECETCAQYLRERDDQCSRLKREKVALENLITELKSSQSRTTADAKTSFADASVNTDEDWANLHSVVVDRMSFDAEVEKNKKLTKTIEELRYQKHELKSNLQRVMEKYNGLKDKRVLEITKSELEACKQELEELKQRCKELDEECETCAEYLRERDDQIRKLKEAKAALEVKLEELQEDMKSVSHSVRKKRQSMHDQNRGPSSELIDASAETSEDFLSYQVERDDTSCKGNDNALAREYKRVKTTLDKVLIEKATLEHQLMTVHPTMYVATGSAIVQNQQLTDVMKENQKLKKMNAKLIHICKKRGKSHDRENEDPSDQG